MTDEPPLPDTASWVARPELEARYRAIARATATGVATLDGEGRIVAWNDAAERIVGLPRAAVIGARAGDPVFQQVCPRREDGSAWPAQERPGEATLRTGQPVSGAVLRLRRPDGAEVWLSVSTQLVAPGGGAAVVVAFADITALREGEERLRTSAADAEESEARFRAAFEQVSVGAALLGLDRRFLRVNRRLAELLGTTPEALVGRSSDDITFPEELDEMRRRHAPLLTGERATLTHERRYRRLDGSELWGRGTLSLVRGTDGAPRYLVGVLEDVTERRAAEAALAVQHAREAALARVSLLALQASDVTALLRQATALAREALGADLVGVLSARPAALAPALVLEPRDAAPELQVPAVVRVDPAVLGTAALDPEGHPARLPAGAVDGLPGATLAAIRPSAEQPLLLLAVGRGGRPLDEGQAAFLEALARLLAVAVQRCEANDALAAANARLSEALRTARLAEERVARKERLESLGQLASGIAHDFNNLLMAIVGFSELFMERPALLDDKEKSLRYLRSIHTAGQDATKVVRRLREFYRARDPGEGRRTLDVAALVAGAVGLTRPSWRDQARAEGRTIEVEARVEPGLMVEGTEADLRDALVNLIMNSTDALPSGGRIVVAARRDGEQLLLEVQDDGVGMDEATRRRCFEPYFTTKGERGSGLGLALVWGIVHRHEGTIDLQSAPGRGTTVTLRLPMHRDPSGTFAAVARVRSGPLRVLVVDDEAAVRQLLSEYLDGDGHQVIAVASGAEALARLDQGGVDLLITDRSMPGMSGDQLASEVRRRHPKLPIVMVTGFTEAGRTTAPEVDVLLSKPLGMAALRRALANLPAR